MVITFRKRKRYKSMCSVCNQQMPYEQGVKFANMDNENACTTVFLCDDCLAKLSEVTLQAYNDDYFSDDNIK